MKTAGIIPAAAMAAAVLVGSLALPGRADAQDIWTLLFNLLLQQTAAPGQPQAGSTAAEPFPPALLHQALLAGQAATPRTCPVCSTPYTPLDPGMSNK